MRVRDIKEDYILVKNYKVSRAKNEDVFRYVVLIKELKDLVKELIKKNNLSADDYLLADKETNRVNTMNVCSLAFSHFWKSISEDRRIFYDLRNTYATAISGIEELHSGLLGLHSDEEFTRKHYVNSRKSLERLSGIDLFGNV